MHIDVSYTYIMKQVHWMIRNRKNLWTAIAKMICVERGTSGREKRGEKKRKKQKVSVKESRLRRAILRNSNPDFGPERGQGTRSAPIVRNDAAFAPSPPPLKHSLLLPLPPQSYLALSLSVSPPDWSASPVIHRKHRMQTVT